MCILDHSTVFLSSINSFCIKFIANVYRIAGIQKQQPPQANNTTATMSPKTGQRNQLTAANLAIHDTQMSIAPQDPTPIQRWWMEVNVRVDQRGDETQWNELVDRDELAKEIERIIQQLHQKKDSKAWWANPGTSGPRLREAVD